VSRWDRTKPCQHIFIGAIQLDEKRREIPRFAGNDGLFMEFAECRLEAGATKQIEIGSGFFVGLVSPRRPVAL
jgi:hypothetical protein